MKLNSKGISLVECSLLISLMALAVIVSINAFSGSMINEYEYIACELTPPPPDVIPGGKEGKGMMGERAGGSQCTHNKKDSN